MVFNLPIGRSTWMMTYLIVIHSVILLTLLSLLTHYYWLIIPITLIILSFIFYLRQYQYLSSKSAITKIARDTQQKWLLYCSAGVRYSDVQLVSSVVTNQVVILRFKGQRFWQTYSVVIVADAVDSKLFHQLRVYCRAPKTFQQ